MIMARGRFHRVAILWLRLIAALMVLYALIDVLWALLESGAKDGTPDQALRGAVWYGIGGLVLWLLSPGIGRLVAAGLDDPPLDPPIV